MVISSTNCSYRTYKYSFITRGPLLVSVNGVGVGWTAGFGLREANMAS